MNCEDVVEKEPLHMVENNSFKPELNNVLKMEENNCKILKKEEITEFSITRESFSELKSSMFKYESPLLDKRLKRDGNSSQTISKYSESQVIIFLNL
jgi:hypothetical protein